MCQHTSSCSAILLDGETVSLTVEMGNHLAFPVIFSQGKPPTAQGEIAFSSLNAAELGLSVGDSLQLVIDGEIIPYDLCGIYSDITNGGKTVKISGRSSQTPVIWSVLYVSLHESADSEQWIEQYQLAGIEVTNISDYVRETYAQTLAQLSLASGVAEVIAVLVTAVVLALFLRLIVEQERYTISLHKALGFTSKELKRVCFFKGFFPSMIGIAIGVILGNLLGEGLCGIILQALGAEGFRFVIDWSQLLASALIPVLMTSALAIWTGITGIQKVKAFECCMGKE